MKATHKIVTALAGAALLVAVAVAVAASFWVFQQVEEATEMRKKSRDILNRADDLLLALRDAQTGLRGYLLTGDEAFLEPYLAVADRIGSDLKELRQRTLISAAQKHLDTLAPLVDASLAHMSQAIELKRNHDLTTALALVRSGQGKQLMDAIRAEMSGFIEVEEAARAQHDAELESSMRSLFTLIVIVSLFTLLFALAFAWLIYRETQQRLKNLVHLETQHLLEIQAATNNQLQQANITLQASEEKLAVTLNSIGDAVVATDADARVTLMNPLAEKLTGWTLAQASGHKVDEVIHIINKESRQLSTIPVMETLAQGTTQGLTNHTILISRDGSECDIADSCAPIRDRDGQGIGAVLVFRDVTGEYAAQQALRESAAQIQTILNTVVDGIITLHAIGSIVETVNPAAERMFGYTAAELSGQSFSMLIPELDQDQRNGNGSLEYYSASDEARAIGLGREVVGRRKDGSIFPMEMAVSEMWLGGQRYFTGILRDITARKQAEEALLKAGALQNAIFNSANFSSIATDAKGVIQIFNIGAERMLGYTAADVMNKITPADISDPQEVIARAEVLSAELGTPITPGFEALVFKASRGIEDIYELTYIRKDGSRFPAVVSVTALRDAQNAIIGYLLIGTDNTVRKQVEAERQHLLVVQAETNKQLQQTNLTLQISEERLAVTLNSIGDAVIATDASARVTLLNPLAEKLTGWTQAQATGRPVDEIFLIINKETRRPAAIPVMDTLAHGTIQGLANHTVLISRDGSECDIADSCAPIRDRDDQVIGAVLVFRDVTGEYAVQQALRDQQFYTRSLIESNIDALMTTDPSGIITDVNQQMGALTGCTRDELIGTPFKNYFTDPERAEAGIKRVLSEKKITDYELTARHKSDGETVVSYNAATFYNADGKLQGVFAAARDITERKRLDQVLQDKNAELESARFVADKANLAKSDFLSSMSHELRTPLNAILGFAQLLEAGSPPPTATQTKRLQQIIKAGWYLLDLINEILDLAVIESGRLSLSLEPLSLSEVLLECQAMIGPQAQQRGINISFDKVDPPLFAHADHTRVKQALINLLSNAIKYNREQGMVEVKCTAISPERIRITIKDSGAGLPPDKLEKLFQPFNRLGQETGTEEGTGIGLVVTKQLVELMGGTVGVESTVGVGSEFWIELIRDAMPQLGAERTLAAEPAPQAQENMAQRTLLYVEDNPANLMLVEQIIEGVPHVRMLSARDATLGIALARAHLPEVILMDINLPGISGIQALKILRENTATAHIPVLAISANAMPRDIEKGLQAGFFRYLTKPIKINEFMDALDSALAEPELDGAISPALL